MSRKLRQLTRVLDVAQDEMDRAEREWQAAMSELGNAQAMEHQLSEFRIHYPAPQGLVSATSLRLTQSFLGKIDEAIEQQQSQYPRIQQKIADKKDIWLQKQMRFKAIEKLVEMETNRQRIRAQNLADLEADDRAALRAVLKSQHA
ncbi:MAG: flagellar export protein FliJ [Gammaproteobacteria bacterium]|nr:flagellar export protein FliJ [Gammaproteobacteria bacterium]